MHIGILLDLSVNFMLMYSTKSMFPHRHIPTLFSSTWLSVRANRRHSHGEYMRWHQDNDLYPLEKLDLFYEYLELRKCVFLC